MLVMNYVYCEQYKDECQIGMRQWLCRFIGSMKMMYLLLSRK